MRPSSSRFRVSYFFRITPLAFLIILSSLSTSRFILFPPQQVWPKVRTLQIMDELNICRMFCLTLNVLNFLKQDMHVFSFLITWYVFYVQLKVSSITTHRYLYVSTCCTSASLMKIGSGLLLLCLKSIIISLVVLTLSSKKLSLHHVTKLSIVKWQDDY